MVNITLSVSDDIRNKMKQFDEVNWSAFIRNQIEKKTKDIEELENLQRKLAKEKEMNTWAVKLVRSGRATRYEELKNKGLI